MPADAEQRPHSYQAEQAVIGGLLIDTEAITRVADVLRAEDFYYHYHRVIYGAALRLDGVGHTVDMIQVDEALKASGEQEEAGGITYLGALAKDTPSAANIRAYAEIVRDRAVERQLLQAGHSFQRIVHDDADVTDKLDRAQRAVLDIGREEGNGPETVGDYMPKWVNELDNRATGKSQGIRTGYTDYDKLTGGLQPGDLTVLAARPSMGKSAMAMDWAAQAAGDGQTAAVFSLEMPKAQLVDRQVAARARVELSSLRRGDMDNNQWSRTTEAMKDVAQLPLIIDDTPGQTITDLRARARRVKQRHGLAVVVVDYLQLMSSPGGENRNQEISEISRGLKVLAKELEVAVVALSQLNRGVEQRRDKRPGMADLRDSGAVEQDADVIAFVYRDEVYDENSLDAGTAELIVGKQRNGPTGTVRLAFQSQYTTFRNLAYQDYEAQRELNKERQVQRNRRQRSAVEDLE